MSYRPLLPHNSILAEAWKALRRRPVMFDTSLLAMVTMLDIWWTLYVVRTGYAIEANPLMAWALDQSTGAFVGLKMLYFIPAIVVFEWIRGFQPRIAQFATRAALGGYVALYVIGSLHLHRLP